MGIIITIVSGLLVMAITTVSSILSYKKGRKDGFYVGKTEGETGLRIAKEKNKDLEEKNISLCKKCVDLERQIGRPQIIEIERPDIITIKSCREVSKEMNQYYGEEQMEMIVRREIAMELTDKLVAEMKVQKNTDYARFVDIYSARIRILKENL